MSSFRNYFFTVMFFAVHFFMLIGIALTLKESSVQIWWNDFVDVYSHLIRFRQFILSVPQRFCFLIWTVFYCYFWSKFEGLNYCINSFSLKKSNILRFYAAGIVLAFSFCFLSEVFYLASGLSSFKLPNIQFVLQSGFFIIISSTMSSTAEEIFFRKVLLENLERKNK